MVIPVTLHGISLTALAKGNYSAFVSLSSSCMSGQAIKMDVVNSYTHNSSVHALLSTPTLSSSSPLTKRYLCMQRNGGEDGEFSHTFPVMHNDKPVVVEGNAIDNVAKKQTNSHTLFVFNKMQGQVNLTVYVQPPLPDNISDVQHYAHVMSLLGPGPYYGRGGEDVHENDESY
uniref:Putative molybdopterin-guanine dinucleotide biosynthesis protein A n=1 Tax=Lygus hesperus TaxID=30085 RepID=A0A0A9WZU0_LYGHE